MDLLSLLAGLRPLAAHDHSRKTEALRSAYAVARAAPRTSFEVFVQGLPASVTGVCWGGNAEDFYLTSLLAPAVWAEPDVDPMLGAVLNHVVLQLNFMTRFISRVEGPESVVLDGDPRLFALAMANGNVVPGVQVADVAGSLPAWTNDNPSAKFNIGALRWSPLDGVKAALSDIGRERVGCLFIQARDGEAEINIAAKYASLAPSVSQDTFYVVAGEAGAILTLAEDFQAIDANAVILTRVYAHATRGGFETRAVVVVSGLDALPNVVFSPSRKRSCRIVSTATSPNAAEVVYFSGAAGEQHEVVYIKPPTAIHSRVPIPEEARHRISDSAVFPHHVTVLKGGMLVPISTQFCNTFLNLTSDGELIEDVGEAHNYPNTPTFQNAEVDPDGIRRSTLDINRVITVKGAAMPLTFTPQLHTFFSHFLLQCFPRVRMLRDMQSDAKIIIDHNTRAKQIEMLRRVGIGEDRLVFRPPGVSIRADELIIPRPWPLMFSPYTLEIYNELIATVPADSGPPERRILISRDYRTTWRTMLTYPAVAAILKDRYNFEEIRPEMLSLDEEIRLYRDARILIGAEGAGLYSACYGRSGSTFVSIADEDYIMPVIGSAASVRGFDVAYVFGESLRADSDVRRRLSVGHSDYVVDPLSVAAIVKSILG